jgi:Delta7-sterol 5-desaturase
LIDHSFAFYGFAFYGIILARYFILAGGTHLFLYGALKKSTLVNAELSDQGYEEKSSSSWTLIRQDVQLSIVSSIVFALSAAFIMSAYQLGITRLYLNIHDYPLWYLAASYGFAIVLQDTYFYFLHRLLHHPKLFRIWHQGHHRSTHPTPWTSAAFDLPEAVAHSLFLVALVFIMPLHFITVIAVMSTMTVWAIVNHLGVDRLPSNFPHHWCSRWFTGPAHHAIHHAKYNLHYGLYFTFWDNYFTTKPHPIE